MGSSTPRSASSPADIKRVRKLENACADLAKAQARTQAALRERDVHIRSLEAQLARVPTVSSGSTSTIPKPAGNTHERRLDKLRARLATLEQRLKTERARARAAESRLKKLLESTLRLPPRGPPTATPEARIAA
jgi:chromosome segregation ATPase